MEEEIVCWSQEKERTVPLGVNQKRRVGNSLRLKKSGTLSFLCLSFILWFLQRRLKRILTLEIQKSEIQAWIQKRFEKVPEVEKVCTFGLEIW